MIITITAMGLFDLTRQRARPTWEHEQPTKKPAPISDRRGLVQKQSLATAGAASRRSRGREEGSAQHTQISRIDDAIAIEIRVRVAGEEHDT